MKTLTVLSLLAVAGLASAADLQMDLRSVFEQQRQNGPITPVQVWLRNSGPTARGVVRVSSTKGTTDYPVELPTGSSKRIFTYCQSDYMGLLFRLITDKGTITMEYKDPSGGYLPVNTQVVALISDHTGELGFLKVTHGEASFLPESTAPERAPDRAVGYSGVTAVVLGDGSERLSDAQVRALQLYALMGGAVVLPGGASPAALRDPRWSPLLPLTGLHSETVDGSMAISALGGSPMTERITLAVGKQVPGTVRINSLAFSRPLGLGSVVALSFDPFDTPLDRYEGRVAVFQQSAIPKTIGAVRSFLENYTRETVAQTGLPMTPRVQEDPFNMQLPPTEQVFGILVLYLILVVPVNFLVLRRMGRGEWAWFTAPILSLAFAGIIFSAARSLYSAQLSTASQGVLVLQEGLDEGAFLGTSQMFMPRSGTYDLRLKGIDSLGFLSDNPEGYNPYGTSSGTLDLQPVDVGEITVPSMNAPNLAFREISYRQIVPARGWFSLRRIGNGRVEVANNSPYAIDNVNVMAGYAQVPIGQLKAGETATAQFAHDTRRMNYGASVNDPRIFMGESGALAVMGRIDGFRPGPQIGREVVGRTRVDLVYIAPSQGGNP